MLFDSFKEKVMIFADDPSSVMIKGGKILIEVNNDIIEASLLDRDGNVYIDENESVMSAEKWICTRLAKLNLLADRILSYIPEEQNFINVSGRYLLDLNEASSDVERVISSVDSFLLDTISKRVPGVTSAIYLTSDAGEGKTTLIDRMARSQAERYKRKQSDWLLLPIPLGGKPFARLDDVIIGTLVNKLRFPFLYYDAIIELSKLGFVVLALDGFEEMFIVTPSGEAISALGNLLAEFNSSGRILIAARKAYFEFKSLKAQSQLFDTLSSSDVSFSKLSIDRWGKTQFVDYCRKMNLINSESIYDLLVSKLGTPYHPLISRAVLVKKLCSVLNSSENNLSVIDRLSISNKDYFSEFIDVIIEREVIDKWIDRGGELSKPLLEKDEHYLLLSAIAEEMWLTSTSSLTSSVMEMIAELVCESLDKGPIITRQVVERIKQHSLIVSTLTTRTEFQFDHEEFRWFFIGYKIIQLIISRKPEDIRAIFKIAALPEFVIKIISVGLKHRGDDVYNCCLFLMKSASVESQLSYVKENTGSLLTCLLTDTSHDNFTIDNLIFATDSLKSKNLSNIEFKNCLFQSISLQKSKLVNCKFNDCKIDMLELSSTSVITNTELNHSMPKSVAHSDDIFYNPQQIEVKLVQTGFVIPESKHTEADNATEEDHELILIKRTFKVFMRSTQVNDEVILNKLGVDGKYFMDNIMPLLINNDILEEVNYRGSGKHKRYKVKIRMTDFEQAYSQANGKFINFLDAFKRNM